jgi:Phage Mu protein F like protein
VTTQLQRLRRLETRADAFESLVAAALKRSIKAGAAGIGQVITVVAAIEPAEPFVSLDDLAAIETAWQHEVATTIAPELASIVAQGASDALAEIPGSAIAPVITGRHPASEMYLAQARNRLQGIGSDLWLGTREQLVEGMALGESARVREEIASSQVRATTIARTEVVGASNAGGLIQMRSLGDAGPSTKTWLSTNDRRTRESHRVADGQVVAMEGVFRVGGSTLDFPGDPTAPAHEVVNCRCTLTWEFD